MKQILSLALILLFSISVFGQSKTRSKVKRKYRDVEQIATQQPQVFLGEVFTTTMKIRLPEPMSLLMEPLKALIPMNLASLSSKT
jgi:hypothetical protein